MFKKSRKIRRLTRERISKTIPKSSKIHSYTRIHVLHNVNAFRERPCKHGRKRKSYKGIEGIFSNPSLGKSYKYKRKTLKSNGRLKRRFHVRKSLKKGISRLDVFRDRNHRINYCELSLSRDIEVNPGPLVVDRSRTIVAPYSQGNIEIFGPNAGQQCVAMSLTALIFNQTNFICLTEDLSEIMNAGNNLYSTLSKSSEQAFLLLTDLPGMVRIFETEYKLQYSESYVGNLFGNLFPIEGFAYCATLTEAFYSLLRQNYNSFILTIGCSTVAIFGLSNGRFKVFDSHSRDSLGMADPEGNCVLIEILSVSNLLEYFQTFYAGFPDITFELKGVHIFPTEEESSQCCIEDNIIKEGSQSNICSCKRCCAICLYSLCFSVIKSCRYWNSDTLNAVIEYGNAFYMKLNVDKHLMLNDLPNKVNICGADVDVVFTAKGEGVLFKNTSLSEHVLHQFISHNKKNDTGFLLWISTYCLSCIFQHQAEGTKFVVSAFDDSESPFVFEVVKDIDSVINIISSIASFKFQSDELHYEMQFILCLCSLTRSNKQKITRKHKSSVRKREIMKRKQDNYATMEPAKKKIVLNNMFEKYRSLDLKQKQNLQFKNATKFRSLS